MNPQIPTQLGKWNTLTFLELNLVVQVLGLAMQYLLATKFTTNAAGELFYAFSVANLVILMIRYLSGESEKRQKLKIVSATIQGLLLAFVMAVPTLVLPFVKEPTNGRFVTAIMMFALGSMIEIAAETQKKIIIDYNNKKLTTDGMFRYFRHPELIGSIIKNVVFLVVAQIHYLYIVPGLIGLLLIASTISLRNEKFSKKSGWAEYEKSTNALIPKFSSSNVVNLGFVAAFSAFLIVDYSSGGLITTLKGAKVPGSDL